MRMTVLGRGLIFQPFISACTYNNVCVVDHFNMLKSRGPRILPFGTPDCMASTTDSLTFAQTYCDLSDMYDWKQRMTKWLFKYTLNFCYRIVLCIKPNVFLKSNNTAPTISERLIAHSHISHIAHRAV